MLRAEPIIVDKLCQVRHGEAQASITPHSSVAPPILHSMLDTRLRNLLPYRYDRSGNLDARRNQLLACGNDRIHHRERFCIPDNRTYQPDSMKLLARTMMPAQRMLDYFAYSSGLAATQWLVPALSSCGHSSLSSSFSRRTPYMISLASLMRSSVSLIPNCASKYACISCIVTALPVSHSRATIDWSTYASSCSCVSSAMCLLLAFLYNRLDLTHFANKRGQCAFYHFQAFSMAIQCGSMVLQYVRVLLQDIENTFDILALRAHNRHEYRELLIIFALSAFKLCESFVSSQCDESFLNAPFLFKFTGQGIFITHWQVPL